MIAQPDASGGLGSLPGSLLGDLTSGLRMIAAGELSKRYGFSFGADGQVTLNANDGLKPASNPGSAISMFQSAGELLSNPLVLAGTVAAIITLVIVLRR